MHTSDTLLFEIGTEELPPKTLHTLSLAFATALEKGCTKQGLSFEHIQSFATPRRLAVLITKLSVHLASRKIQKRGPALSQAFDAQKKPTPAMLGFLQSCNTTLDQLTTLKTDKGEWLIFETEEKSKSVSDIIPSIIEEALQTLPIARRMRWGQSDETFVRPIHWVVLLLGEHCIDAKFFGIPTGRSTFGHRFHAPFPITISHADQYETLLEKEGFVIANFEKRKRCIQEQIQHIAAKEKASAIIEDNLLEEVTALVEWPNTLLAHFDKSFLEMPKEVLITAMQVHQKCFALVDTKDHLLPAFVVVSNIQANDASAIVKGNERVMHARLKDAVFHYQTDKKTPIQDLVPKLNEVLFQAELGSLGDKTKRLVQFCKNLAKKLKLNQEHASLSATLCKADLLTYMVGEFPELQGVMGYHYALAHYPHDVALAIREHYLPRFSEDMLPTSELGYILALADRLDNLLGLFGIGKAPTGDKDPFALRRQAFGVVRILVEKKIDLDLLILLQEIHTTYQKPVFSENVLSDVLAFCFERLRAWYQEKNVSSRVFDAVLAKQKTHPFDFHQRVHALNHFQNLPNATVLLEMNKRVHNILAKADIQSDTILKADLLKDTAEKKLAQSLQTAEENYRPLFNNRSYRDALTELTALREPLDQFFNDVMVMVDDPKIRQNRLALLQEVSILFSEIADLTLL